MVDYQRTDGSATRCIRLTTVISVALLAVIAAVVSFGHMGELALRHGEASWSAIRSASMAWSSPRRCRSCRREGWAGR